MATSGEQEKKGGFPELIRSSLRGSLASQPECPSANGPSRGGQSPDEVRPEKVARARKLAADPSYPPKRILHAVARFLTRQWYR